MSCLFSFQSSLFDLLSEPENPFNPIKGYSVAKWVCDRINRDLFEVSDITPEDWGWYCIVRFNQQSYLLGFSADFQEGERLAEVMIQLEKNRSFLQKLRGANRLAADDIFLQTIRSVINELDDIQNLEEQLDL